MKDKKILNSQFSILNFHESGQALLVILLIMAVALTIGLSITSRSITDIKISELSEEGARAFSAAEAGIEEALLTYSDSVGEVEIGPGITYETETLGLAEGATEFAFPSPVNTDQVQTLWLANHSDLVKVYDRNKLRVVWGKTGPKPALEVTIYYDDNGSFKAARFAIDPDGSRATESRFCHPTSYPDGCEGIEAYSEAGESVDGVNFQYGATLNLSSFRGGNKKLLFARLRILYENTQPLGAKAAGDVGSPNFPSQGILIDSTGQAGEAMRKVRVIRYHPAPLPFFDMVLYSQTDLKK